jgi:hypothetical protein
MSTQAQQDRCVGLPGHLIAPTRNRVRRKFSKRRSEELSRKVSARCQWPAQLIPLANCAQQSVRIRGRCRRMCSISSRDAVSVRFRMRSYRRHVWPVMRFDRSEGSAIAIGCTTFSRAISANRISLTVGRKKFGWEDRGHMSTCPVRGNTAS